MVDVAALLSQSARAVEVVGATPQELYDALIPANAEGLLCRVLRGHRCETLDGLFDEVAGAFQFPPFFGANKGAYEDLMRDLSWLNPRGAVILGITDADRLMCRDDFEELMWFVEVSFRLAHEWSSRPAPGPVYRVVLQSESPVELKDMMDAWVKVSLPTLTL